MDSHWGVLRYQEKFKERFASKARCVALAKDAKANSCWINVKKDWFTPEEFIQEANSHQIDEWADYTRFENKDIKIKDPREMIIRLNDRLRYFKDLRDQFVNKVDDYYFKNPNKRKNRS